LKSQDNYPPGLGLRASSNGDAESDVDVLGLIKEGETRPPRILIVGGAGYLGSILVRRLLHANCNVRVMDALVYGDEGIRELYGRPDFDVVPGDLRNVESTVRALRDIDAVVHLGALVGDPACALDEKLTLEINLDATRTLVGAARGMGVTRFVFASTCSVYGAVDEILDERSALDPISLYAQSKMDSERLVLDLASDDFVPIVLRFGTFYGLSPRPRFDLVVNLLAAKAVTEGKFTIFGGNQWRPFIHVEEGARAVMECLTAADELVKGEVFNAGSDEGNHTLRQIADLIKDFVPTVEAVFEPETKEEANYRVSFAKIRERLGFTATRTISDGIVEIKTAIENGTISDFLDERYSNVKALTEGNRGDMLRHSDPIEIPARKTG
jgi:nucleoside-diphosphate-sugar epimerase